MSILDISKELQEILSSLDKYFKVFEKLIKNPSLKKLHPFMAEKLFNLSLNVYKIHLDIDEKCNELLNKALKTS